MGADSEIAAFVQSIRHLSSGADTFRRRVAARLGIGLSELQAMGHLYPGQELQPKELADRMALTAGGMTPLLDRLETHEYVVRSPHPSDRRRVLVALTSKGDQAVGGAYQAVIEGTHAGVDELMAAGRLAPQDLPRITDVLDHLSGVLARIEP